MKKAGLLSVLGVLAFLTFLVAKLPVSVVWQIAQDQKWVPASVKAFGIEGTLWQGSARTVTIEGITLPKTIWTLSAPALLGQTVEVDIQTGHSRSDLFAKGQLSWDGDQLSILDVKGRANSDRIQQWVQLSYPVTVNGRLSFNIPEAQLQQGQCKLLDGQGTFSQAGVETPLGDIDLDTLKFDLACQGNRLTITASQNSDELQASAKVLVDKRGRYTLNGHLVPKQALSESFRKGLSFLGQANGDGVYSLNTRGVL